VADYMAFLRGINLGNRNVKGPTLVRAFEDLGYEDVATFIASGNVVFRTSAAKANLERAIEDHLADVLGYDVDTFIRTHREVARIAAADPFPTSLLGGTLQVGFLKRSLAAGSKKQVAALSGERDELVVKGREIYWLTAGGVSEADVKPQSVDRIAGTTTRRNMKTITRLAEKYPV
jgi:uncharacterized protein (DUF1697 family)